ncbi:hypothetical protein F0562_003823 [Nyssa sinensis]|uniref:PH domain-containing protein n=1 Tax=Nyssa sinensis TaxID=561372 RepID=A0A5J5BW21_9ASTE|nr:hypothetical protein F0562_003823 [Nyssa sinensis]
MFEGLVRQLLLGYLGQYIKDIQKEQLKITLWNEEVLLENVELILEAFDYLQLPFALKQGCVGRLSIKIPWKKLGWDPIIILLEDVFICGCQRDDQEWSMDAVERREFAGKKAKLAAVELAKLSRLVCDNQAGQSFISYITAKILDGIQVSIRNVHFLYRDILTDSAHTLFGLKFSSLTIMKQTHVGLSSVKVKGGQVNKLVEIQGLQIYCSTFHGTLDLISVDIVGDSKFRDNARFEGDKHGYILAPVDVSVSLLVNKSGRLENDDPQYSIDAKLTGLIMSLDEVQLQQIVRLWDYLCTCRLREKYGRYRPWNNPLSRKLKGWQTEWWHYAQQSVLSDVRKRLKKTSWKYLGERLKSRRKYVNLYKTKLECLRREQLIDEDILRELEEMEKDYDIDDILSYRSTAECELQEFLVNSDSSLSMYGSSVAVEKSQGDERSSSRPRGWLNWLSRGMLGAGGTDDSSQFSGVVSEEVIKDIHEATKFHPLPSPNGNATANNVIYLSAIKFEIPQVFATLQSMRFGQAIAELTFKAIFVECKLWEESVVITASVNATRMVNLCNKEVIVITGKDIFDKEVADIEQASLSIQVDVPRVNSEVEISVKVICQPLEVTWDSELLFAIMEFYNVLESFKSQHERVLLSLNGIEDVKTRLLSKAEYILSSHKRVIWDVSFINIILVIPWENANSELHKMMLKSEALFFTSIRQLGSFSSAIEDQPCILKNMISSSSTSDFCTGFQLQDLYDYFEGKVNDFEMKIIIPHCPQAISVLEKFCAETTLASCIIPDDSIQKQLEVYIVASSLQAHLSPVICGTILGLIANLKTLHSKLDFKIRPTLDSLTIMSTGPRTTKVFSFSVIANLESVSVRVDLDDDKENSCILLLALEKLHIRYALREFQECWISMKALSIMTHSLKGDRDRHMLFSSGNLFAAHTAHQHNMDVSNQSENSGDKSTSFNGCFLLHYEAHRNADVICHKYTICLNNVDLHCYPYILGLLLGFSDKISEYGMSHVTENSFSPFVDGKNPIPVAGFGFERFGFSNFFETGSSELASIPLDFFPFVTIHNFGSLGSLETSLIHAIPDWRKIFNLREKKIRSPKFSVKKGSKILYTPPLKSTFGTDALPVSQNSGDTDLFVDLNLSGIRVHFHDSSCIVGTITLPTSRSSLSINKDSFDILCSTEGLMLSSSWWTQNIHDFLWGPSLPNLSNILNIRVRKVNVGSLKSQFEISFSVQHVSCILPPELLAIIIGYFSSPDWSSNGNEQSVTENSGNMDSENASAVIYKFEILDSILFTPVASNDSQFLKLEIPQLYCSFLHNSDLNVLKDIPPECLVPAHKISDRNQCLNLFGRDLSLSLMLLKDDAFDSLMANQSTGQGNITFIAHLSADIWVRIPHESVSSCVSSLSPTCIMVRVGNCQLIAEDGYIFVGFEALLDVVNQFSSVHQRSKGFTSDVLQFLQLKKSVKENSALLTEASTATFTEMRCCVNLLSINFYRGRRDSFTLEPVAKADVQFISSVSLRNEIPLYLDISFSSLTLFSSVCSVMLAQCTSSCSFSSVLDMHLSMSDKGASELHVALPSLNIWLHLSEWTEVIVLFNSYTGDLFKTSIVEASSKNSVLGPVDQTEDMMQDVLQNINSDAISLIVKSENIGITIYIPAWVNVEAFIESGEPQVQEVRPPTDLCNMVEGESYNFIAVTFQSRCSELVLNDRTARLKSSLEKTNGTVGVCKDKSAQSRPLFQLSQVNVEAEICNNQMELVHVKAEVQCDSLDVWLSYHVFYFWQHIWFKFPEEGSSQFTFDGIDFKIQLRKISLLLTDARWSSNGPLLELLMRNLFLHANMTENKMESSVAGDLQVNYNNIHKVLWEPFVEPWKFQLNVTRICQMSALLNSAITTDIHLQSTTQLNLNVTEPLIEVVFRAIEMIKDAWGLIGLNRSESQRFLNSQICENMCTGRYAPYILQNLTSLPLVFHVCQGPVCVDDLNSSALKDGKRLQPGSCMPIYINETPEEQLFRFRPSHSSDRLCDNQLNGTSHHYIIVQLDGTSIPSAPISMDLVGISYFEVDFSNSSNKTEVDNNEDASIRNKNVEESNRTYANSGFVVPVVFDVSVQRYSKLVRLYSTVILLNATPVPFELRFDIPFGVSPKILDPIYPGQEFPLPLHLAQAGRMRWRPLGHTYLWSEAHNISNILSREFRVGFLRSFVCYPSHPSNDPFRCCISVQDMCLPSTGRPNKQSLHINNTVKQSVEDSGQMLHNLDKRKKHFIHQVTLSSPLVVRNYLPEALSLTIESGGVTRTALLSEVETSFFHIDSSHDLGLAFQLHGFKPSILKFPRAESFSAIAKFSGTKFSLSETITFDPAVCDGPVCVTVEKVMDALSGAREICIFVPFLLYNCTGFPLIVSNSANETKGHGCIIPSCYDLDEQDLLLGRKDGLGLLSSNQDLHVTSPCNGSLRNSSSKNHIVSTRKNVDPHYGKFFSRPLILSGSSTIFHEQADKHDFDAQKPSLNNLKDRLSSNIQSKLVCSQIEQIDSKRIKGCMYSPNPNSSASEIMVRASRCLPECVTENMPKCSWSSPFLLVPPTGSTSVLVPHPDTNAAYVISVTSNAVAGPFTGRTRTITFQPRYVISNACSKDLSYKQKGTDFVFHLGIGQHHHLHWMDTRRELLVSIRFNEPGWQWSGSFLPEHLGDTQVKMRNYVSGAVNMIRVEVQNADVSIRDEKIVGSPHGNSGTNLILLSDDDMGFMPYRIDNFTKEKLRMYQQRCETFETIIHSYTSCPYAWDEPCYPHRLTVEVPGERIMGSYTLDEVREYTHVYLPQTSEKPERTFLVSVHAEGATKVLSIIDSSYHILNDVKDPRVRFKEKRKHDQKEETFVDCKEKISVVIPFIGISLMNSYPQELLFACAKNTTIDLLQSLDRQRFSFQISWLQIDNQLHSTPYPVILSFDHENRSNPVAQMRTKDDNTKIKSETAMQIASESLCEPIFCFAAAKWRNKDISLVSFEYISLRVADFLLELEQEVILSLFDFFKTVSSRFESRLLPCLDSSLHPLMSDVGFAKESSAQAEAYENVKANGNQLHSMNIPLLIENHKSSHLPPPIVPIGAPWQQIYLLARRQKKIYVEVFDLAPIKLILSFSSNPWILRNGVLTSGESLIHRGLMALADVEGAQIYLKQLTIAHHMASWESILEILVRHYTRQTLHEMYKVFGSAGVIGNPMGFARNVGVGIKDFLSVPARSVLQSPGGLITGMAQGTTSLLSNTVYALSNAATQFSRAAHKGIVAFTFDDQAVAKMEKQQKGISSHSNGVINEFFEGLTGLLQSPIKGAEQHGLPGVLSGIALGITGLVARPAASILEVTGKTAQSIRNRSKLHQMGPQRFRVRLPRPLSRELPLRPYSWEEAVGTSILAEADDGLKLKNEMLVMCKALKQGGQFVVITERLLVIVSCACLVDLGKPEFPGIPADPEWVIEAKIGIESVIHADRSGVVVHIVGSSSDTSLLKRVGVARGKQWYNSPTPLPLFQTNLEFIREEEAEDLLQVLLSTIEKGKEQGWGCVYLLHQSNLK